MSVSIYLDDVIGLEEKLSNIDDETDQLYTMVIALTDRVVRLEGIINNMIDDGK